MWGLIGEALGFVRETVTRRFKARKERVWKDNEKDIKKALADRDVGRLAGIFKRLRRQGNSTERR
jgi:hypothetical protein|tara:strand:+ start:177 stop:371 length:195 start_codon:yes stop_codon:yes gene_type:complete